MSTSTQAVARLPQVDDAQAECDEALALATIVERLSDLLEQESLMLNEMQFDAMADLEVEKSTLVEAYERHMGRMKSDEVNFPQIDGELRERLKGAGSRLKDAAAENERALRAVKSVSERVLKVIVDAVRDQASAGTAYGSDGAAYRRYASGAGTAPSLAVDRQL